MRNQRRPHGVVFLSVRKERRVQLPPRRLRRRPIRRFREGDHAHHLHRDPELEREPADSRQIPQSQDTHHRGTPVMPAREGLPPGRDAPPAGAGHPPDRSPPPPLLTFSHPLRVLQKTLSEPYRSWLQRFLTTRTCAKANSSVRRRARRGAPGNAERPPELLPTPGHPSGHPPHPRRHACRPSRGPRPEHLRRGLYVPAATAVRGSARRDAAHRL